MLTDLDDLMLKVRDPESRTYLREALICYRGGAFRAAVVSVWIAVVFDIISKIRVLASHGELHAKATISNLDNAITNHDIKSLQKIEESMLDEARDKFQFVNRLEHEDLERIKQDRNKCAHPAFSNDTLLFNPSAEVVRAHIVHAISHLLAHPPVQGKSAIENALRDISSLSFPGKQEDADKFMNLRYLDHARESLVASLVSILMKSLFKGDNPTLRGHEDSTMMVLISISRRHPGAYESKMREILPKLGETLDDVTILNIFPFLPFEQRIWSWVGEATQMRATNLVKNYTFASDDDGRICEALNVDSLSRLLLERIRELEPEERFALVSKNPRAEFVEDALALFEKSKHFRESEPRARLLFLVMRGFLTVGQLARALDAVPSNYEIWNASKIPGILANAFDVHEQHFDALKDKWVNMMNATMKEVVRRSPSTWKDYEVVRKKLEAANLGPFDWVKVKAEFQVEQDRIDPEF